MLSVTVLAATATTALAAPASSNCTEETYIGPENGHLVILGGNLSDKSIYERIFTLTGGSSAPFVGVPTAGGEPTYNDSFSTPEELRRLGVTNVTVLHTYDAAVADIDEFIAPLKEAKGIFFGEERQWRLVDAYAGTKSEKAFQDVLDRGGVISGSTAGASIQGSFLARGDTANNHVMVGAHTVGSGYLKNAAIDQHFMVQNRHFDMFDVLKVHPKLLGIFIDESTAVIVNKNDMQVFGPSYVAIYDGTFYSDEGTELKTGPPEKYSFLFSRDGQRYDLGTRKVVEDEKLAAGGRDEL